MRENKDIITNQRQGYGEKFKEQGATPKGLFWSNTETQYERFNRIIKNLEPYLNGSSIHDIGSGSCDLHKYLISKNIQHKYSGTEIVQEMIDFSMNQYPEIEVFNRDLISANKNETYDFIVLSGTLNLLNNQEPDIWKEYCYSLIEKMYTMANKAISFNCLTSFNTFSDPTLFYFNPMEVFEFCMKNLSRFIIIDHGYPLYEFTCTVFKPEFLQSEYESTIYSKYFKYDK